MSAVTVVISLFYWLSIPWLILVILAFLLHLLNAYDRATRLKATKPMTAVGDQGLMVYAMSPADAAVAYDEIWRNHEYEKHGVELHDGDVVVDIGANVGIYSTYVLANYPKSRVYSFEPIPGSYSCTYKNTLPYADRCITYNVGITSFDYLKKNPHQGKLVSPLLKGLQDNQDRLQSLPGASAVFTHIPMFSVGDSMYYDSAYDGSCSWQRENEAVLEDLLLTTNVHKQSVTFHTRCVKALLWAIRNPILTHVLHALFWYVKSAFRVLYGISAFRQLIPCKLYTLSDIIKAENIGHIDVLKIDVEGAEMDVLEGLTKSDYQNIKSMVIEVHDVQGRVKKMEAFLRELGYRVTTDQQNWAFHRAMKLYIIYAVKDTPKAAGVSTRSRSRKSE